MSKMLSASRILIALGVLALLPAQASTLYTDSAGDIDGSISTGAGTLDILSMEVSNTATDLVFALTVNGNVAYTDWGNFMIGIATGGTGTTTGNGWNRPINLDSPIGGMDYWISSWVISGGGGAELYAFDGATWLGPMETEAFNLVSGATSTITYTLSLSSLGLSLGDTIYFDAYSSGQGGSDSAVDSLSNPNISITDWSGPYTSNLANGISSYTLIPEPATSAALLGLLSLATLGLRRRPRG